MADEPPSMLDALETLAGVGHLVLAAEGDALVALSPGTRAIFAPAAPAAPAAEADQHDDDRGTRRESQPEVMDRVGPAGRAGPATEASWQSLVGRYVCRPDRAAALELPATARRSPGQRVEVEFRVGEADRTSNYVRAAARADPAASGTVLVVLIDFTARRLFEDKIGLTAERLQQLGRWASVGETAGTIAHEITQPLAAIGNYAQAATRLASGARDIPADLAVALAGITEQALRAGAIVQRLRGLIPTMDDQLAPADLNELSSSVALLLKPRARRSNVELRIEHSARPLVLPVRAASVQLALVNLVSNAIDATLAAPAEPGAVPYVSVRVAPEPRGGTIAVEDHGAGAPQGVEQRLFEPFFTTKPEGTGLGLVIARAVAERHGGRLEYARNPGRGMTFTLTLPERATPP